MHKRPPTGPPPAGRRISGSPPGAPAFVCPGVVDRARTRHFSSERPDARHGEPGAEAETFAAIAQVRHDADLLGEPMANVALAWLLAQEGIASVIAGGRNADQALRNTAAADLELSPDLVADLAAATDDLKQTLGHNADMWQTDSRIH